MNIHEKVEQQYKVVQMYNDRNDTTELFIGVLEDLLEEFKNNERDPISLVNEMKEAVDNLYVNEYEKEMLYKIIRSF